MFRMKLIYAAACEHIHYSHKDIYIFHNFSLRQHFVIDFYLVSNISFVSSIFLLHFWLLRSLQSNLVKTVLLIFIFFIYLFFLEFLTCWRR